MWWPPRGGGLEPITFRFCGFALGVLRPDLVGFEQFEGAGHVRVGNVDRDGYTAALRDFLAGL